jgi:hypothetical protein
MTDSSIRCTMRTGSMLWIKLTDERDGDERRTHEYLSRSVPLGHATVTGKREECMVVHRPKNKDPNRPQPYLVKKNTENWNANGVVERCFSPSSAWIFRGDWWKQGTVLYCSCTVMRRWKNEAHQNYSNQHPLRPIPDSTVFGCCAAAQYSTVMYSSVITLRVLIGWLIYLHL